MTTRSTLQHGALAPAILALVLSVASMPLSAQEADTGQLRQNIEVLSGVLEEALNLNETAGLFGIALGGVESTYLHGQGIVMEVRTPLANRRNRLSLAALTSTMQSLGARANPFEAMRRGAVQETARAETTAAPADTFYRQMMERIAAIDYSLIVNTAIQQASNSARSLRSLAELDDDAYQQLQAQIEALRERTQSGLSEMRALEVEIRQSGADDDSVAREALSARLDALLGRIEPLREEAVAFAQELRDRTEAASARYGEVWRQELAQFEMDLYTAVCDFGASLRALPADERLSIILTGLGADADDNRRTDKVHVLNKADIQQCQSGTIDVATLRDRSVEYSY
ncbi:MAG: hypothetical protein WD396_12025 [Pseudohongiellaceae bacterium]